MFLRLDLTSASVSVRAMQILELAILGFRSICLQDFHGLSVKIGLLYVTTGTINMKKVKVATGLLVASLILLIIYGADVAVSTSGVGSPSHSGFLPINKAARGGVFGGGAVIMSIIGFVITRGDPSQVIAILLIINGGIIIAGMIILIAEGSGTTRNATITISSTIGTGIVLVGLGIAKVKLDRALIERKH